jgi:hypothetical protein
MSSLSRPTSTTLVTRCSDRRPIRSVTTMMMLWTHTQTPALVCIQRTQRFSLSIRRKFSNFILRGRNSHVVKVDSRP